MLLLQVLEQLVHLLQQQLLKLVLPPHKPLLPLLVLLLHLL
jgi:hypothetical protein